MQSLFAKQIDQAKCWPRLRALGVSGIFLFLTILPSHTAAQNQLVVQVNNISIAGQFSLRGLTADFPFPVMTVITVTDLNAQPITGLADTTRWLGPPDLAENGRPITQNWTRLLEYHRNDPAFPPDPNLYNQNTGPLFTEVRASTPIPTSTMLVMDVSGSMIEELADAKTGNLAFLDQLRPIDRAGVIQFCAYIKELLPFTSDKAPLKTSIAAADTCPATGIYDALMTAIQETKRENYRRAIILYTDGIDNSSVITQQAVIDSAQFYNLPIFTIALGEGTDNQALQDIATNTGGLFFATINSADFVNIYKQLAVLIQNYYVMAHASPDPARNGTWRVVEATANTPTRAGSGKGQYFVPGQPALQPTDLAVAMNSLTGLAIYENGKIINAVQPGEQYQYRLNLRNLGSEKAEGILLTQTLPDSVLFIAATPAPFYSNTNSLVWQIPQLNAGAVDSITVTVQLVPNVPPTLQSLISSANILAANDNSPGNNTAVDTVRVLFAPLPQTDVAISQAALTDSFAVAGNDTVRFARSGETYEYRLTVTNRSTITAKNITITDFLPDSVRVQNFQPLPVTANTDSVRWVIASLPPQSSTVLRFDATVSSLMPVGANLLINKVFTRADNEDPNRLADNTSIDTVYNVINPPPTDVAVSMISHTDTTIVENGRVVNANKPGQQFEYQINIRNFGPARAESIRLRQVLPDSVRFITASQMPSTAAGDSLVWQIASLNAGVADSINVTVQLAPKVPPDLKLLISRADLVAANDSSPGNNAATDTVRVVEPATPLQPTDVAVSMISHTDTTIVENGRVVNANKPGQQFEYQINIRNFGPARAESIRLRQVLPDSVRFITASQMPSTAAGDSLVWQIASLNAGAVDSINVTVQLAPKVPPNLKLLISRVDLFAANDSSPGNNAATDTVRVVEPATPLQPTDVAMSMISHTDTTIVENGRVVNANKPGQQFEYQINIRNFGPARAESIRLQQVLPDSVRFITASQMPSTAAGDSLVWQIASLNAGAVDSINVTVQLAPKVPPDLKLLISRADLFAANDSSPGNNAATDTVRVVEPATPLQPTDVAVSMISHTDTTIVENGRVVNANKPGQQFEYQINIRNFGPARAESIRLRQVLPDSVRFITASQMPSTAAGDSLVWQIASLNAGVADSINVTVQLAPKVPPDLKLLISRADLFAANDSSPGNNAATDTVRVVEPATPLQPTDVAVSMISHTDTTIVENGRVVNANKPGQQFEYQINIRNFGPARAESIRLQQVLPDSVRFITASQMPSTAAGDSLVWQIASLNAGAADSITVTVQLAPTVPPELKLLISRVDLFAANDNSPGNNSVTDTVRVVEPATPSLFADITVSQFARTDSFAVAGNDTLRYARRGETYRYTIAVVNVSTVTAQNITVTDFLPDSVRAKDFSMPPSRVTGDSIQWVLPELLPRASLRLMFNATVPARMPVGTNLFVNTVTARAANDDPSRLGDNTSSNTVYNVVKPVALTAPLIEALPPEVTVGSRVHVRVQVLVEIVAWDLWVYFADGQVDTTFADAYIKANLLRPDGWRDVAPDFTNTQLFTAAKEEEIRFEIRTYDTFGNFASASAPVKVRSANNMVLDRNVFKVDTEPPLGISFRLSSNRIARLELYDLNGLFVTKIAEALFNADWNTYHWNGLMEDGRKIGSGVYVVALRSGEYTAWKKFILVR